MAEYIDRESVMKRLLSLSVCTDDVYGMGVQRGIDIAEEALNKTATADVVEVVRCKDCKHATFYSCRNDACYRGIICEYLIGTDDENFFCGYGERKEQK